VDEIFAQVFRDLDGGLGKVSSSDESAAIQLNIRLFEAWQDNAEVLCLIRSADVDRLILARLRAYQREAYDPIFALETPQLNPALAGYLIDFIAGTTFTLLTHWLDEKMHPLPEVMGQLLYDLTGPNRLRDVVEKLGVK
jgi:hypothetical protein